MLKKFKSFKYRDIFILSILIITYTFILFNVFGIFSGINKIIGLLNPFLIGFSIAYLLNSVIKFIKNIWFKIFNKELNNGFSIFLSYFIVFLGIAFLIIAILPQVITSFNIVITESINVFNQLYRWIESDSSNSFKLVMENKDLFKEILNKTSQNLKPIITGASNGMLAIFNTTSAIIYSIFSCFFGILISIYMLMHKDIYKAQAKKATFAMLDEDKARTMLSFWTDVNNTFSRFINARIVDSIIIGILCWIGCLVLGLRNSVLIAFVVGVTNVIPYFGPFIGAMPCALITLIQGPMNTIVFLVFLLILQQFDCNILGPKLLGDSLGLTSLWIIFAVAITTSIFGIIGMIIGVPLFAIIYMLIKKSINNRLKNKGLSSDTSRYIGECENIKEEQA